jgi:uncharacterized protein YecA (UPF0149 family)
MAVNIFRKLFGKKEKNIYISKSKVETKTKHYSQALKKQEKHPSELMPEAKPKQDTPALHKKTTIEREIDSEIENLPPQLLTQSKDPRIKEKLKKLAKKMAADGVNLKSAGQVKKWVKTHPDEIRGIGQTIETYHRETPKVSRNAPCPCGSGRKYKKCCGRK